MRPVFFVCLLFLVGCAPIRNRLPLMKKGKCLKLDGFVGVNIGDAIVCVKKPERWLKKEVVCVRYANGEVYEGTILTVGPDTIELDIAEPEEWNPGELVLVYSGPLSEYRILESKGKLRTARRR